MINSKEKKKNIIIENKGNWEFNFYQKKYNPNNEINIKTKMISFNTFNIDIIYKLLNKNCSKEDIVIKKKENGIKLNTKEQMLLNIFFEKKKKLINVDFYNINKLGTLAKPITKEGKAKLLLLSLTQKIKSADYTILPNIYFKLIDISINDDLNKEYNKELLFLNDYINSLNIIELQFTKLYSSMPPLNETGFNKLDDWQLQVIHNIDNNITTLISAPTSAGKSVLSGYTISKGNVLFIVPTDALTWQMSAYISSIIDSDVPIISKIYQSHPSRDEFIEILNNAKSIVATPDALIDFLPFLNIKFKWIVIDEIHMIEKIEGNAIEYILKLLNNIPILGLSATISNIDELVEWIHKINQKKV